MRRAASLLAAGLAAAMPAGAPGATGAASTGRCGLPAPAAAFSDCAAAVGLDFVHFNGMSGEYYFPEMAGGGAALVDYDGDGDLDVYLVQGAMMGPGKDVSQALLSPRDAPPLTDRLYRNDLAYEADGRPWLAFADVTARAGLRETGYGMGVAAGDADEDGDVDLYVTNFGRNAFLRNLGDGTWRDDTEASGTDDSRWSVAASFFDYDRDGRLDLYVGNYVDFTYAGHVVCTNSTGARDYCGPLAYDPEPHRLFRNRGDGTFADVSVTAGIHAQPGTGLGALAADLTGDGWPDLYVANDMLPNFLWVNQRDGTFRDEGLFAGCALSGDGRAQASMGVDAGDFDADGDDDLFMTHLSGDYHTLYVNDGDGMFRDQSAALGIANPSWNATGFGTAWIDFDGDGWLDLAAANGAVKTIEAQVRAGEALPLRQRPQLFRNLAGAGFEEVPPELAGDPFAIADVGRGLAAGDVDEDGDADLLLAPNGGAVRLLINQVGQDRPWLGARLLVSPGGADHVGSRAGLLRTGRPPLWRRSRADGSYASAQDPRVLFGLDGEPRLERLRVEWADGRQTEILRPPRGVRLVLYRRADRPAGAAEPAGRR